MPSAWQQHAAVEVLLAGTVAASTAFDGSACTAAGASKVLATFLALLGIAGALFADLRRRLLAAEPQDLTAGSCRTRLNRSFSSLAPTGPLVPVRSACNRRRPPPSSREVSRGKIGRVDCPAPVVSESVRLGNPIGRAWTRPGPPGFESGQPCRALPMLAGTHARAYAALARTW